ncbi:hypothetical protein Kpol_1018p112 [Vanderwaltozyma polyspora DSM 70294]|uniref:Thioesterase domain-containing protein n=1 Tax=Vanderwaltozyma polyspora (strain ATCC 22028 / DSM 70294 / BCRC 21397 / CBS 2163 / NBRC 10782 / NRRL Y-8283 / UCD 57-17) TaxID=436907 RepID=A7TDV9_VANPO|nr:uncharacterized protein Kpol_1018p112 [Vanderwaltozyma polyspora DSM 70294]EDO19579.1 hypothetical protein Kpol_1018p112 [Vanderwaltozyma polyspora DSM 70294]
MLRTFGRTVVLPTVGFTLGVGSFIKAWPDEAGAITLKDAVVPHLKSNRVIQRPDILEKISQMKLYNDLLNNPSMNHSVQSEKIPRGHLAYHVGQGELFGPNRLEIDPLIFFDEENSKLVIFYHLGKDLGNEKGNVHKGVLSLLLDEALCYCGFPKLPSKRGVTAKLHVDFTKDIPVDSTVILRADVTESKGRKCIIDGTLETVPTKSLLTGKESETGTVFAKGNCILVEPKWFKYFTWLDMF